MACLFNVLRQLFIGLCLINAFFALDNDIFDDLWNKNDSTEKQQTNKKEFGHDQNTQQAIGRHQIKAEPQHIDEWQHTSSRLKSVNVEAVPLSEAVKLEAVPLSGAVKVEAEPLFGAKLEAAPLSGAVKIENDHELRNNEECSVRHTSDQIFLGVSRAQGKKYTDEAKIRIVKKFYKMKAARRSSEDKKSYTEINEEIANKLGVSRTTIFRWKSKFQIDGPAKDTVTCQIGQSSSNKHSHSPRMITWYTDDEKKRILKKYIKLKVERSNESEVEIANKLGVSRSSIVLWKKEFLLDETNLDDENEKVQSENIGIFERYKNLKNKNPKRSDIELAKQLRIGMRKLSEMKKRFDLEYKKKHYTEAEKMKLLKKYYNIKRKHPELNQQKIGQLLNISKTCIIRWKKLFPQQDDLSGSDQSNDDLISPEHTQLCDQEAWAWNRCTKPRTKN